MWTENTLNELQELVKNPDKKIVQGSKTLQLKAQNTNTVNSSLAADLKWNSLSNKEKTFVG